MGGEAGVTFRALSLVAVAAMLLLILDAAVIVCSQCANRGICEMLLSALPMEDFPVQQDTTSEHGSCAFLVGWIEATHGLHVSNGADLGLMLSYQGMVENAPTIARKVQSE